MRKYSNSVFRDIEPAFSRAEKELKEKIEIWYQRLAENNEISLAEAKKLLSRNELKEFRWTVNDYVEKAVENVYNSKWIKQLENASAKKHINRLEALLYELQITADKAFGNEYDAVDKMLKNVYKNSYYHTLYDVQIGLGVAFEVSKINETFLNKILTTPWASDKKVFSQRIWENQTKLITNLKDEIIRMSATGEAPDKAIKELSKLVNSEIKHAKSASARLIQTEQAYFLSDARNNAYKELEVEEYEIIATLDSKTSEICQELDLKVFKVKDYTAGITAPPFHPRCRTTTAPYFDDYERYGTRIARNHDNEIYYVPADMSYKDWLKTFEKA